MIVKKLYRKVKSSWWDKELETHKKVEVIDYLGWYLFGIIPIYLIELNRKESFKFDDGTESNLVYGINEKYKHLIQTIKE